MVSLKCKMCGGDLELITGENICECQYCGSRQTVPIVDDDRKAKLYERANKLRFNCDFDKAASVYENIINEFPDDAEGYWGLVLCNYGIEYVDDPATGKKVPTCHRSSFESLMDDPDFEMVMENSEDDVRALYRQEAKQIEEIRRGIIEISGKEQPYDIFICYKETDKNGERTIDSVLAQDVYDALTQKGYRVFFSRISLEDKLGTEYEPYIFAALNSAKIMLAFGTSYDNYNAVWVKNEWGRFLKLMASDKEKYLIPCYKDIDAYDIPKEFAKFQAQDLGKVGATQDLLRGIDKILRPQEDNKTQAVDALSGNGGEFGMSALNAQTTALLKRGYMMIEDGEFERADELFEQALNNDAESGRAYWGKAMCGLRCTDIDNLNSITCARIDLRKKTNPIYCSIDLIEYARTTQDGKYANFSNEELEKVLKGIGSVAYKDIDSVFKLETAEKYYKSIASNFDVEELITLINNRDFDRAVKYADDSIRADLNKMVSSVKKHARACAEKEQNDLAKRKNAQIKKIQDEVSQKLEKSESNKDYKNRKKEKEELYKSLTGQREALEEELKSIKVKFNKTRRQEIEAEIKKINSELQKLSHI